MMKPNMEKIEALADAYAEQYVDRFKKVAKQAYIDGILEVLNAFLEE